MGAALRAAIAKLPREQPAVDVGDAGNLAAFAVAPRRRALLRAGRCGDGGGRRLSLRDFDFTTYVPNTLSAAESAP